MGDELLCSVADGVATVTLNRPAKRNALNRAVLEGLAGAFERLEGDPTVRVVVVRGAGPAFCSGMDLDELARQQDERAVEGLARTIAANAPLSLRGMKRTILRALAARDGIDHADLDALAAQARRSRDARKGVRAMLASADPETS